MSGSPPATNPVAKPWYKDLEAALTVNGAGLISISVLDLAGVLFRLLPLDGIAIGGGVLAFVLGFLLLLMGQPSRKQGRDGGQA